MIRRGEVYWVNLNPVLGSELGKRRPAVVLQNDRANSSSPTVTVLPISSRVDRVYPFQVRLAAGEGGIDRESKVLCEQIRTLSKERLSGYLGRLDSERLENIRDALDRHLWLEFPGSSGPA